MDDLARWVMKLWGGDWDPGYRLGWRSRLQNEAPGDAVPPARSCRLSLTTLAGGGERAPGGLPGLQNRWGAATPPAGSIPVRLRYQGFHCPSASAATPLTAETTPQGVRGVELT
jgi:hypothetical protein